MTYQTFTSLTHLAVTYNCNSYGASTYNSDTACTTTTPTNGGGGAGLLGQTGYSVYLPLAAGVLLIVIALTFLFVRRRRNRNTPSQRSTRS